MLNLRLSVMELTFSCALHSLFSSSHFGEFLVKFTVDVVIFAFSVYLFPSPISKCLVCGFIVVSIQLTGITFGNKR